MTEAEWVACMEPRPMLEFMRGKASDRKYRLFGVACCFRVWNWMVDARSRQAVETAEIFADEGILMDVWIAISEAGQRAYRQAEQNADTIKSQVVREGIAGCTAEAICHAALAAYHIGHYPFQTVDLPGNPKTIASAVANVARYAKGVEMGVTLAYSGEEFAAGPMRAAWTAEQANQVPLVHCLFANPFRPVTLDQKWLHWNEGTVRKMAQVIYDDRVFGRLPVLADALDEAGCHDTDILNHCHQPGPHVRGCWVVDLLLGKE